MRVSKEQATKNREKVVETASCLFRERGLDGVGIDAIMAEAGLTHGGFYKAFASKEALVSEACAAANARSVKMWSQLAETAEDPLVEIVSLYLSPNHRERPGSGCVVAALAADAGRRDGSVRQVMQQGVENLVAELARAMPVAAGSERPLAAMATMVGAMVLARAVDDSGYAERILHAAKEVILEAGHPPHQVEGLPK